METNSPKKTDRSLLFVIGVVVLIASACGGVQEQVPSSSPTSSSTPYLSPIPPTDEVPTPQTTSQPTIAYAVRSKWELWSGGQTYLRGANIWQALVVPELDGLEFKGPGPVGPPFSQTDFDHLALLGANYVVISHPGLFTEKEPFEVDPAVVENLDHFLAMIAKADMFAVIAFRTGPGRSEYTVCCGGEDWAAGYFNDTMWQEMAAQDAWVEMWRFTAERYRDNPIVVGYELMVEPNSNGIFFDVWEPEYFYPSHAETSYDWNPLYARIVTSIREVDTETPILIDPMSYGDIGWLSAMQVLDQQKIVYFPHQYTPHPYTHQWEDEHNTYPGTFDLDYDGDVEEFDYDWLSYWIGIAGQFAQENQVVVGIGEYGLARYVPDADRYLDDLMGLFEQYGFNYSIWEWSTSYRPFVSSVNEFNFRFGTDLGNDQDIENPLLSVLLTYWQRNVIRPSTASWNIP